MIVISPCSHVLFSFPSFSSFLFPLLTFPFPFPSSFFHLPNPLLFLQLHPKKRELPFSSSGSLLPVKWTSSTHPSLFLFLFPSLLFFFSVTLFRYATSCVHPRLSLLLSPFF